MSLMCTLSWVQISSGEWWRCGFPFTCHKWNFHLPSWPPLLSKGAFHLSELSGQTMAGAVILTMKKAFPLSFCWKTISFLLMISKILITAEWSGRSVLTNGKRPTQMPSSCFYHEIILFDSSNCQTELTTCCWEVVNWSAGNRFC